MENGIYIFFYHSILDTKKCKEAGELISLSSVDKKSFEQQIRYFKKKYTPVSMDEAHDLLRSNKPFNKKYVVITIDDGYKDNFIYGYDLFKKYKMSPTIFLTANNVDKSAYLWPDILRYLVYNTAKTSVKVDIYDIHYEVDFDTIYDRINFLDSIKEDIKKYNEEIKYEIIDYLSNLLDVKVKKDCDLMLNWDEVKKLNSIGVNFGAHTLNHPILSTLSAEDATDEIYGSKVLIEARTNKKVEHFAYPNGRDCDISEYCINEVKKYYKTAVTTTPGINKTGEDLMRLKRIGLAYDLNIIDLKVKILYFCIIDSINNLKKLKS
ncbi:MAG: polysaccharide deacetylase family protein [Bacillota bacterium]|nr:polysaccharide deacetylase family protein [Bacillota bacterium]